MYLLLELEVEICTYKLKEILLILARHPLPLVRCEGGLAVGDLHWLVAMSVHRAQDYV